MAVQFATGNKRCSARSASLLTLRHDQRHVAAHSKRCAVVDHHRAVFDEAWCELLAGLLSAGKEDDVEAPQRRFRRRAYVERIAAKTHCAGPLARCERTEVVDGNRALFQHAKDRLSDRARCADDRDVHSRTDSRPTEKPRRFTTARTAASIPATKDSRVKESCRIVNSSPGPPKSTS